MKIVLGDPNVGVAAKSRLGKAKLKTRRVRDEQGQFVTVYVIDPRSKSLSNDMLTVFRRNVARARRQTQAAGKKLGVPAE
jgi:hypothetical protein